MGWPGRVPALTILAHGLCPPPGHCVPPPPQIPADPKTPLFPPLPPQIAAPTVDHSPDLCGLAVVMAAAQEAFPSWGSHPHRGVTWSQDWEGGGDRALSRDLALVGVPASMGASRQGGERSSEARVGALVDGDQSPQGWGVLLAGSLGVSPSSQLSDMSRG